MRRWRAVVAVVAMGGAGIVGASALVGSTPASASEPAPLPVVYNGVYGYPPSQYVVGT